MRTNKTKQKLQRGRPTIGTWLTLGQLQSARILARSGFDWLTIDAEHYAFDWREIQTLLAAIADAGCVPLVRVPDSSHTSIKGALDAGAYGIVVPMIETVQQAQKVIAAAKYPPLGNRSVGGGMHNLNFDCSPGEYYQKANDQVLVVLQTESPLGIHNAREIYSLPGCDAIFIGPNDLRYQMRSTDGTFPTAEEHEAMVQRAIAIGREVGTPTGIHVFEAQEADERIRQGMQFIAIASDMRFLAEYAKNLITSLGLEANEEMTSY